MHVRCVFEGVECWGERTSSAAGSNAAAGDPPAAVLADRMLVDARRTFWLPDALGSVALPVAPSNSPPNAAWHKSDVRVVSVVCEARCATRGV